MYSTSNTRASKKEKPRRRRYFYQICIVIILIIIVLIFFIMNLIISFHLSEKSSVSEIADITPKTEIILSMCQNCPIHYIYIDIGCFNGETIEHFLHFVPNSTLYNIITFEPDPQNYQLCKKRLSHKKFSNINIIILQKVVWIRDEKVSFHTGRGRYSRININKTADNNNSEQLNAIDFSSWLARLARPNKTKIYIKMSLPGAEIPVLEKMIRDDTLRLADKYEVEWADRENPYIRPIRIYIQLMFDNRGFDCLYYTRLEDTRKIFKINGTFKNVTKFYDWKVINESDTYGHYHQRLDEIELVHQLNKAKEENK